MTILTFVNRTVCTTCSKNRLAPISIGKVGKMLPAGYSDNESDVDSDLLLESDYGMFDDYDSNESGYDEPSTPINISLENAMRKCLLDSVQELIPQIEDYENFTLSGNLKPLQLAAQLGKPELVEYFINLEATRKIDNSELIPVPLILACSNANEKVDEDHLKCAELLLKAGMNVDSKDLYGVNALMTACKSGTLEMVQLILSWNAQVNVSDNDDWSPLFYAANRGDRDIVLELLKHEVDLNKLDKRNRYAYSIAYDKGFTGIADLIKPEVVANAEKASLNMAALQERPSLGELISKREPDYFTDVFEMLSGVDEGMERYAPLFRDKKINLREFLLLKNEKDLKNIGITFSWHRQTIINRIKQFHLGCWYPSSLGLWKRNEIGNAQKPSQMMSLLTYMFTLRQQMFVLKTSLEYLRDDMLKFIRDDPELVETMKRMQKRINMIILRLRQVRQHVQKVEVNDRPRLLAQQV